jgi:PTS system mannose-specific IIB component
MSVILVRIDDRLVHGQVIEGWVKSLRINHVVVASDAVAADEMQRALYCLAVPYGIKLDCLSVIDAAKGWAQDAWGADKVILLTSNPQDVVRLVQAGAPVKSVNVGGMHYRQGRIQVLKAVSLDDSDVTAFRVLAEKKIALEARPLPLDEPVNVSTLLNEWQQQQKAMGEQPR